MRSFLILLAVGVVAVLAIAGRRGSISRQPPIEVFPDMDRQPKLRPQQPSGFFANQQSSQLPVAGTVARDQAVPTPTGAVFTFAAAPVTTGRVPGTTNFVETNPLPVSLARLRRGQERFMIHCAPCHGGQGDGNGASRKLGMAVVANLHDPRLVEMPDGALFSIVTHGKSPTFLMPSYAGQVAVEDRWAIIAYVRALQRSRLGSLEDLPAEWREKLSR